MRVTAVNVVSPHETTVVFPVEEDQSYSQLLTQVRREFKAEIEEELKGKHEDKLSFTIEIALFYEKKEVTKEVFDHLKEENPAPNDNVLFQVRFKRDTNKLQKLLDERIIKEAVFPYGVLEVEDIDEKLVRARLLEHVEQFLELAATQPRNAAFYIPSRSTDNVFYHDASKMMLLGSKKIERTFRNLSSVDSIAQMAGVMKITNDILRKEIHVTKRDLFYTDVSLFGTQRTSDSMIEDLGAMLQVTRNSLNIMASAKGKVIGRLTYREDGDYIDCTKGVGGRSITPMIDKITDMETDAELVLLIEKDAAFQRLAEDKFFNYIPSIIITASGQPDMATRLFVKKLYKDLDLPILGLMDADPYGLDILRVYTIGSRKMSLETAELAVPDIKWLGLLPSDLDKYEISNDVRLDMSEADLKRAEDLMGEEFVKSRPSWEKEINIMIEKKKKAEIQALASRDPLFMTNHYLPKKINDGDWL